MSTVPPGAESDAARIDRLERELEAVARRHRYFAMFAITFMLLVLIAIGGRVLALQRGRLSTDTNELFVRDQNGTIRASLIADEDDAVRFRLYDPAGKPRVTMVVTKDGIAGLGVNDANANTRAAMGMSEDQSYMFLNDKNVKPRIGMTIDKDGPAIDLADEGGKNRVRLSLVKDAGGLLLFDGNGKRRAEMTVDKEPAGVHLELKDENGKPVFSKP